MRLILSGTVLLAFLVLPGFAADEPKNEKKNTKPPPRKDNGMIKAGQLVGQIISVDESRKSLKIRYEVLELNQSAVNALVQAQYELQRATTVQAANSAQQKIAQQQANLYTKKAQEAELSTLEDCVVRLKDPPPTFDDKGRLIKPTPKQLAEWKGDPKLPGYKAEFGDLRANQYIQITLMRLRNLPRPKINPKTREVDPDTLVALKPQISLILILGEPRQPAR